MVRHQFGEKAIKWCLIASEDNYEMQFKSVFGNKMHRSISEYCNKKTIVLPKDRKGEGIPTQARSEVCAKKAKWIKQIGRICGQKRGMTEYPSKLENWTDKGYKRSGKGSPMSKVRSEVP